MLDSSGFLQSNYNSQSNLQAMIDKSPTQYCVNLLTTVFNDSTIQQNVTKTNCTYAPQVKVYGTFFTTTLYSYNLEVWTK